MLRAFAFCISINTGLCAQSVALVRSYECQFGCKSCLEEKDLMPGDVTIAVDYSTVNYKDGFTLTARAPVIRTFPLIPCIDLSGTVEASSYSGIELGDKIVANGWGLSQTHRGGYAQKSSYVLVAIYSGI